MLLADMGADVIKVETPGEGDPVRHQGAIGVCAALVGRGRTGTGDTVGASLTNGLISFHSFLAAAYFAHGTVPARTGNDHAIVAPYGLFRTSDGEVAIAPSTEMVYRKL